VSAADAVTAAEARALLDAVEGLSGPALFTTKRWTTSPEEAAALRAAGALFAAAPALARTVIALHENIEFLHSNMDSALGHIDLARAERARERKNAAARERLLTRRTDALRAAERERDALAGEVERLRHMRDAIAEDHEECSQYRNWLANPARVGRCHVCDLLHSEPEPTP